MKNYCDLHTHSLYSDGTLTPGELIAAAGELGLSAIALCDHNTVDGLPEFVEAGEKSSVTAVPGIEFSTDHQETELHILALFLPRIHWARVGAMMEDYDRRKEESNLALIDALARKGFPLDYEAIKAPTPRGHVNRSHFAAAMTEMGYTPSNEDAFATYLSPAYGLYDPPQRPDALEIIQLIHSLRAVPVLAHPFLNLKTEEAIRGFLGPAREAGLMAMETRYPLYDEKTTLQADALAAEFGLLPSGGSDFHGSRKNGIFLGTGRGDLRVPADFCRKMALSLEDRG